MVTATDAEGNTTLITLDARGKPAQVQQPFKNNSGTIVYNTVRYTYDQVGNQTKVETPRGVARISVQIGIDLYDKYGANGLTPERLQEAIISAIPEYESVYDPTASPAEETVRYD